MVRVVWEYKYLNLTDLADRTKRVARFNNIKNRNAMIINSSPSIYIKLPSRFEIVIMHDIPTHRGKYNFLWDSRQFHGI